MMLEFFKMKVNRNITIRS